VAATRANPDAVADHGIDEIAAHYATYMATLPSRPIVVGHSFGGLLDGCDTSN
jgi:pimeloyl-ACP methyl ester carboxylesterase